MLLFRRLSRSFLLGEKNATRQVSAQFIFSVLLSKNQHAYCSAIPLLTRAGTRCYKIYLLVTSLMILLFLLIVKLQRTPSHSELSRKSCLVSCPLRVARLYKSICYALVSPTPHWNGSQMQSFHIGSASLLPRVVEALLTSVDYCRSPPHFCWLLSKSSSFLLIVVEVLLASVDYCRSESPPP